MLSAATVGHVGQTARIDLQMAYLTGLSSHPVDMSLLQCVYVESIET